MQGTEAWGSNTAEAAMAGFLGFTAPSRTGLSALRSWLSIWRVLSVRLTLCRREESQVSVSERSFRYAVRTSTGFAFSRLTATPFSATLTCVSTTTERSSDTHSVFRWQPVRASGLPSYPLYSLKRRTFTSFSNTTLSSSSEITRETVGLFSVTPDGKRTLDFHTALT